MEIINPKYLQHTETLLEKLERGYEYLKDPANWGRGISVHQNKQCLLQACGYFDKPIDFRVSDALSAVILASYSHKIRRRNGTSYACTTFNDCIATHDEVLSIIFQAIEKERACQKVKS